MRLGSTVPTIGFPNVGLQGFAPKLARGEIAALSGVQDGRKYASTLAGSKSGMRRCRAIITAPESGVNGQRRIHRRTQNRLAAD
jgi:hypothetical protein